MFFSHKRSGQPGPITRIMCCTPEEYERLPEADRDLVPTHVAPSFTHHPRLGDVYSAYNKPLAIIDWVGTGQGGASGAACFVEEGLAWVCMPQDVALVVRSPAVKQCEVVQALPDVGSAWERQTCPEYLVQQQRAAYDRPSSSHFCMCVPATWEARKSVSVTRR